MMTAIIIVSILTVAICLWAIAMENFISGVLTVIVGLFCFCLGGYSGHKKSYKVEDYLRGKIQIEYLYKLSSDSTFIVVDTLYHKIK